MMTCPLLVLQEGPHRPSGVFLKEESSDGEVSVQERKNIERGRIVKVSERILFVVYV